MQSRTRSNNPNLVVASSVHGLWRVMHNVNGTYGRIIRSVQLSFETTRADDPSPPATPSLCSDCNPAMKVIVDTFAVRGFAGQSYNPVLT